MKQLSTLKLVGIPILFLSCSGALFSWQSFWQNQRYHKTPLPINMSLAYYIPDNINSLHFEVFNPYPNSKQSPFNVPLYHFNYLKLEQLKSTLPEKSPVTVVNVGSIANILYYCVVPSTQAASTTCDTWVSGFYLKIVPP